MKKKFLFPFLCFILLLLIGIGLMLYPLISNWYGERVRSTVEVQYNEAIAKLEDESIREAFRAAQEYNESLYSVQLDPAAAVDEYDSLLNTLVASFSNINSEIIVFSVVLLAGILFFLRKDLALLDVITLGKAQATNLGVDYDRTIRRLLLGVTLAIAVATAMVGPISFLGLIIANLSRQLLRTFRHSQLVLGSTLFGMIVLVAGQLIVEHVFTYAIPVSVFITVGGGLYFLYLLLRNRRP